jgi:hypothetical protein
MPKTLSVQMFAQEEKIPFATTASKPTLFSIMMMSKFCYQQNNRSCAHTYTHIKKEIENTK